MNAIHSKDLSFAQRAAHIRKAKAILAKQPKNATAQFNLAILLDADGHKGAALEALKKTAN